MKIDRIKLHNFKCFEDTVELDGLGTLESGKPIILFGGLNGAGKTTILEAILLALYGRNNKTLFPTRGAKKEDYDNYIYALVNNGEKSKAYLRPVMWVELGLSDVELGGIAQDISIRRKWIIKGDDNSIFSETVEITDQNGEKTPYVTEENYNEFIERELIPYGISQFFLFDGENIQDFVRDEDKAFADSLEEALGLSLHRLLEEDLRKTKRQILTDYNRDKDVSSQMKIVEAEIEQLKTQAEDAKLEIEQLEEDIDGNKERIADIDRETQRISKVRADDYEAYEAQKAQLNREKGQLESEIGLVISDIPFAFMAEIVLKLQKQLQREQAYQIFLGAQKSLEPKISLISDSLFDGEQCFPPLSSFQQEYYSKKLRKILREVLEEMPPELNGVTLLHEISSNEINSVNSRIESIWPRVAGLSRFAERFNEIEPQLERIRQSEVRTNDPEVQSLYEEKAGLAEKNASMEREIVDRLLPRIKTCEDMISSKARQLTELERKIQKTSSMKKQVEYCDSLIETLQEFSKRFRQQRVEKLEQFTLEMLQRLARKSDFVSRVEIVPEENFSVRLYDGYKNLIDKTKISKGEKELVAISLIWALSKLANRDLPLVIDTPLARLDSEHRQHIVEKYYPFAGTQVILLSTDTEVVGDLFEAVKPHVSKTFLIEKDSVSAGTRFVSGYFS